MDNRGSISVLSESILRALIYYDLFDFPLTAGEIYSNLPTNHVSQRDVDQQLEELVRKTIVFKFGDYFSVQQNPALQTRRDLGNSLAQKYLRIAIRRTKLISQFPFVRCVMVSGSLSKGYADVDSDIDFFVITKPGRLWIVRSLLVFYRRLAFLNSHKYFCVNYFIDEHHLEIEEKNRFTATELSTLIPLFGIKEHRELLGRNHWISDFLPNFSLKSSVTEIRPRHRMKKAMEWVIDHLFPDAIDSFIMRLFLRRWKKMHEPGLGKEFKLAFKTNRSVSKSHPKALQNKIMFRYEERVRSFIDSLPA